MSDNTKILIDTLKRGLDEFTRIEVINRDPNTGERQSRHQGVLSVVFRAYDETGRRDVALKFFDPDFRGMGARYRMDLFERESKLLERVRGRPGFLQLVRPLSEIEITATEGDRSLSVPCAFFVIEWLDGDITSYFNRQDEYDALIKLELFREALLGVFRLHGADIAHRDLKCDNLRRTMSQERSVVIPIDYGTAVDIASPLAGHSVDYEHPVGAGAFSPLEAHVGLAAHRSLVKAADIYALGCLLHDLFNTDILFVRLFQDPGYQSCFGQCRAYMTKANPSSQAEALRCYRRILGLVKNQVSPPHISSEETTVPAAARELLDRLLQALTSVDYLDRETDINKLLRILDAATRSLQLVRTAQEKRRRRRIERDRRAERIREKEVRLERALEAMEKERNDGSPTERS